MVQTGTIVTPVPITLGSIDGRMEGRTKRKDRSEGGREEWTLKFNDIALACKLSK